MVIAISLLQRLRGPSADAASSIVEYRNSKLKPNYDYNLWYFAFRSAWASVTGGISDSELTAFQANAINRRATCCVYDGLFVILRFQRSPL